MLYIILLLFCRVIWALVSREMASKRGRDKNLATLAGFLFGCLVPIYYLIVGNSDEKKASIIAKAIKDSIKE